MLLLAFPLEFEGNLPPDDNARDRAFTARRRAMLRLYSRGLGFEPLPNQKKHKGWMWRQLHFCPEPLKPRRKRDARAEASR